MRSLIDEHVPNAVASSLRDHGHEGFSVRHRMPLGTPDPVIVTDANQLGAIIITWNRKHFAPLISRENREKELAAPNAGLLSFDRKPAQAVTLLERHIRYVEFAYQDPQDLGRSTPHRGN